MSFIKKRLIKEAQQSQYLKTHLLAFEKSENLVEIVNNMSIISCLFFLKHITSRKRLASKLKKNNSILYRIHLKKLERQKEYIRKRANQIANSV